MAPYPETSIIREEIKKIHNRPRAFSRLATALLLALFVAVAGFIIWGLIEAAFPPKQPLQGQMESRTISISSKVAGRVEKILVLEGDTVTSGETLVEMDLPELEAKLAQVQAQEKAALAKESLVQEGARPQEKGAAKAQWQRASVAAELARKSYDRINSLYKQGLIATQKYDEALANWKAAEQLAITALSQHQIAEIGSREQEKTAISSLREQATAGVLEVEALASNKTLKAPLNAQVDKIILVEGELASAGFPILTLMDPNDQWAAFNIREAEMPGIQIGTKLTAYVPPLGNRKIDFEIYYISPRANYATWRSNRQDSGYDMKTFEVRGRPLSGIEDLRPGMTVLVDR